MNWRSQWIPFPSAQYKYERSNLDIIFEYLQLFSFIFCVP